MYRLWTPAFLAEPVEDTGCYTTEAEWTRIHAMLPEAKRIFGRCIVGDKEVICALGPPLANLQDFTSDVQPLVIPLWFHSHLSIEEGSKTYNVDWMTEEAFPAATKIVLRPQDSAFYHSDAKEELESALTRYGVLQKGTTIPVALEKLGGFQVMFDIIGLEPANVVLMEGEEVSIEFEGALDEAPFDVEPIPEPPQIVRTSMPFSDEMLPVEIEEGLAGIQLGGTVREPLPDGRRWNPWR